MFKRHKRWIALIAVSLWIGWGFIPFPADAAWSRFGAWDTITKLLGVAHTWTATQTFDENVIIDDTSTEALLVRQDADGGDVFTVDTTNAKVIFPIGSATHPAVTIIDKDGSLDNGFFMSPTLANRIEVAIGGSNRWEIADAHIQSLTTSGMNLNRSASSATSPSFRFNADNDTGVGRAAADALSLIAGGVEGMRITETATGDITIVVLGTAPAASSCGTTPSITGSDAAGKLTIGTGTITSCTATFANAFTTNAPACVIAGDNSAITYAATTSTTVLTITSSADMATDVISYICLGIL